MTNEELADLITARTANLRDHLETRLQANVEDLREHFDRRVENLDSKLGTIQTHIYGQLLTIQSDLLDLQGSVARLREAVNAQARRLEERR
jgi:hypothetical protein